MANTDPMDMSLCKLWELMMDREARRAVIHGVAGVGHDWATELNWTKLIIIKNICMTFLHFKFPFHGYYLLCISKIKQDVFYHPHSTN